jgi:hypothetical protein
MGCHGYLVQVPQNRYSRRAGRVALRAPPNRKESHNARYREPNSQKRIKLSHDDLRLWSFILVHNAVGCLVLYIAVIIRSSKVKYWNAHHFRCVEVGLRGWDCHIGNGMHASGGGR